MTYLDFPDPQSHEPRRACRGWLADLIGCVCVGGTVGALLGAAWLWGTGH